MDDSNNSISVTQALNQLQSWLNAGEFEKVVQGCGEILQLEPGNQRALALMKIAEERRSGVSEPAPAPMPAPEPAPDPLADLQVENAPRQMPSSAKPSFPSSSAPASPLVNPGEKRQLFLAMLIPAVLVVLVGGTVIWYLANLQRANTIAENSDSTTETPATDTSYLQENDQRIDDMSKMKQVIETYKATHGAYPSAEQIEVVLVQSDTFSKVPSDPQQGVIDKSGKPFGYVYAVYESFGKANQVYVLSALFQDSKGFGYPWTVGAPIKNYPDYRNVGVGHATFIGNR